MSLHLDLKNRSSFRSNANKSAIQSAGLWEVYVSIREQLIEKGEQRKDAIWTAFKIIDRWPDVDTNYARDISGFTGIAIEAPRPVAGRTVVGETAAGVSSQRQHKSQDMMPDFRPAEVEDISAVPVLADGEVDHAPKTPGSRTRRAIEWVFENVELPLDRMSPAPSQGATALMQWARYSMANRAEFYRNIWTKVMPSKSEIDAQDKMRDDGREILETIERIRKIAEGCGAERLEEITQ